MRTTEDIGAIARQFQIEGQLAGAVPIGSGHIHDSYRVTLEGESGWSDFVLQRINTRVFTRPADLMENVVRITSHMDSSLASGSGAARRALHLVPARNGTFAHIDPDGSWWRIFAFIPGARAHEAVTPEQARQVAHAIGQFQLQMASLGEPRLHDTIPDFHNTPLRLDFLKRAIDADVVARRQSARAEIEFALERREVSSLLVDAGLPERIVHNDAKSGNVLLDDLTGEAVCVIDLDTVMSGLAVHDFGDMVRSMTSPAPEDEHDLSRVYMQFDYYEAMLHGYVSAAASLLTGDEIRMLPDAGKVITYENGLRFLADYLTGDTYYKTAYPEQNLHRCRTQFALVRSIEEQEPRMRNALRRFLQV
jgi:Ser/Thr protein kinase RdoA (MazF antagonist)